MTYHGKILFCYIDSLLMLYLIIGPRYKFWLQGILNIWKRTITFLYSRLSRDILSALYHSLFLEPFIFLRTYLQIHYYKLYNFFEQENDANSDIFNIKVENKNE